MKIFPAILLLIGLLLGILPVEPAQAGVTRVSILLTGEGCAIQRQSLADRFSRVQGIAHVDGRSVPDHLLIDIEDGTATAEQLVSRVNEALASTPCRAEEMKSCITAELPFNRTSPAQK